MNARLAELYEKYIKENGVGDVAMWHKLSGLPENVTDEGHIVDAHDARRQQADEELLYAAIMTLSRIEASEQGRCLGRLAASYLVAGDIEAARRYVEAAQGLRFEPCP